LLVERQFLQVERLCLQVEPLFCGSDDFYCGSNGYFAGRTIILQVERFFYPLVHVEFSIEWHFCHAKLLQNPPCL